MVEGKWQRRWARWWGRPRDGGRKDCPPYEQGEGCMGNIVQP